MPRSANWKSQSPGYFIVTQSSFTDDFSAKRVDKKADFENLTLCISINSSQICTYFFQALSCRVQSVPGKKLDSLPSSVVKLISLHTPFLLWA